MSAPGQARAIPVIGAEVEDRLDWGGLVDALAEGHRGPAPALADSFVSREADTLLTRSAWIDGLGAAAKAVTIVPGNAARGLPSVQGALVLFDDRSGSVEAVIDSALVTKWKTAADSLLGARLLAPRPPRRVLIVGAGAVAASLVEAYAALYPDVALTIWNRDPARAERLCAAHAGRVSIEVAAGLEAAVAAADIVSTATLSREPVLRGEWLVPGQHIDLIGAFRADMREADDAALRRCSIFVDSRETTLAHIGELAIPLAAGVIRREDVRGDLAELVRGAAGRRSPEEITLFKNGGGAHLDLMTARYILAAARRGEASSPS